MCENKATDFSFLKNIQGMHLVKTKTDKTDVRLLAFWITQNCVKTMQAIYLLISVWFYHYTLHKQLFLHPPEHTIGFIKKATI